VFKRGDVVLVLFPNSNLQTAKTRPALVIQADGIQTGLSQVLVAMISSQMSRAGHRSRVGVRQGSQEWQRSGLLADSVVMTDNIATVIHAAIHRVIGELPMNDVDQALRHTLGL
jgi:Growth inhibitor